MHLIEIAVNLALGEGSKPRQSELPRAVSSAYYAMFHCICQTHADVLSGASPKNRNNKAWLQAYALSLIIKSCRVVNEKIFGKISPLKYESFVLSLIGYN
ncbi:MAG: hypothetical protein OXE59_02930 [Bacteroidetes bacterium]|nr:hypothetical protein [Bacteroidota bacterium]